jgi:hypothetical protein
MEETKKECARYFEMARRGSKVFQRMVSAIGD